MSFLDDVCRAIGKIGRCLFDMCVTVFEWVIEFFAHVVSWARDFANRCWSKIKEGWRIFYVDVDVNEIPPDVIPKSRLNGAKKVSLGILTDPNLTPKSVDRVFLHNEEDDVLKQQMGGQGVVELTL